jgi:hypothetical protein
LAREQRPYLPSHRRAEEPPTMRLTERDRQIVKAVSEHRLLSSPQIEALFFRSERPRGRRSSCQRRLQLLFHHGFLDRLQLPVVLGQGRRAFVYVLAERGADLVAAIHGMDRAAVKWKPKHNQLGALFIDHALAINGFRVALHVLGANTKLNVCEWIGEADLRSGKERERVPIRMRGARVVRNFPDGYFRLALAASSAEAHFFLEVDQGTMSNVRWQGKVKAYSEFRGRGLSHKHFGTRNFRILVVTTSQRRLVNLKRATERAGGEHYFWFTLQGHVDIWQPERLLQPIWHVATQEGERALFTSLGR